MSALNSLIVFTTEAWSSSYSMRVRIDCEVLEARRVKVVVGHIYKISIS